MLLKTQQKFRSEMCNVFTKEISKIALNANDYERMKSIYSLETYAFGLSKDLVSEKDEIKCNNIINRYKND